MIAMIMDNSQGKLIVDCVIPIAIGKEAGWDSVNPKHRQVPSSQEGK
jgi:hypothetical protein